VTSLTGTLARLRPSARPADRSHVGRVPAWILLGSLTAVLLASCVLAAGTGQLQVPPDQVLGSLLHRAGLDLGPMPAHPQGENALWVVRFPRVCLAVLVGAALGCAGAALQGIFGNPLAEPGVIGVSAGAAVGAAAAIVFGAAALGGWAIAAAAFAGGLITTLLVYALARSDGRAEVVTLVLTGVALNAFAGGVLAALTYVADEASRDQIVFWQLGSLNGATWSSVGIVLPLALGGIVVLWLLAGQLDLLALGERAARHLGVDVERLRRIVIVVVALLVASGVAFTGIIAFIGLIVPHLIRMIAGPGHRLLVPASALTGALILVLADLLARNAVENADLPLGMLTSLVGGPVFFWLLRRTRRSQGGWA
jgi:iron complex transport system permease protein